MHYNDMLGSVPGPDILIVDMYDAFVSFYGQLRQLEMIELDMNSLMDELVSKLAEDVPGDYGISMVRKIVFSQARLLTSELETRRLDIAIEELGSNLLWFLRTNGLYTSDRIMYYGFEGWADPFSPILRKQLSKEIFEQDFFRQIQEKDYPPPIVYQRLSPWGNV